MNRHQGEQVAYGVATRLQCDSITAFRPMKPALCEATQDYKSVRASVPGLVVHEA